MAETVYGPGGDFSDEDPSSFVKPTDQMAAEFLLTVDELEPRVLDDLRQVVALIVPRALVEICKDRAMSHRLAGATYEAQLRRFGVAVRTGLTPKMLFPEDESKFKKLGAELSAEFGSLYLEWLEEHRLTSRAICQVTLETLADWKFQRSKDDSPEEASRWGTWIDYLADPRRDEKEWDTRFIAREGIGPSLGVRTEFQVSLPDAWKPFQGSWKDAKTKIQNEVDKELENYRHQVENLAAHSGTKSPRKRKAAEHLRWIARYQVVAESYRSIAASVGKKRTTVKEAVERMASELDLPLRERSRGGRPTGVESTVRHRAGS